jgi:magnesium chelatase family protein
VGLADKGSESRKRVRAALSAIGLALPFKCITVNLGPADLPKEGSHYDLPIALGPFGGDGRPAGQRDGKLRGGGGIVAGCGGDPGGGRAECGHGGQRTELPAVNGSEAAFVGGDIEILAMLIALVNYMKGAWC